MADTVQIKLDFTRLDQLNRDTPGKADQVIRKIAFDLEADTKNNFSDTSPSAPGDPPGIVTGNLKASVQASKIEDMKWQVVVGAEYGTDLEFGTRFMAARPFVRPAIRRVVDTIPGELKAAIE